MFNSFFQPKSFWTTLPGILTGCGAIITAMATLVGACVGVLNVLMPNNSVTPRSPNLENITAEQIHLPDRPGIPEDLKAKVVQLIVAADKAQIQANFYQDVSYLQPYYTGQALSEATYMIEEIKKSGYTQLDLIDLDKSYYVDMRLDNNILSIDSCEYWQSFLFDSNENLVSQSELRLVPQTISFESVNGGIYISAISFYQNNVFCTK